MKHETVKFGRYFDDGQKAPELLEVRASFGVAITAFVFCCVLLVVSIFVAVFGTEVSIHWPLGDWLINYEAGIVRRGFAGELFSSLDRFGFSARLIFPSFLFSLYLLLVVCCFLLFVCRERSWPWLMLFCSPAFLAFPFWSVFQGGYFRKEIAVIAVVALICARGSLKLPMILSWIIATTIYTVGALSHEIVALSLPVVVFVVASFWWVGRLKFAEVLIYTIPMTISAAIGIFLGLGFSASFSDTFQICRRIIEMGFSSEYCQGAVLSIAQPTSAYTQRYTYNLENFLIAYLLCFVLALFPVALFNRRREFLLVGVALFVFFTPIYFIATDWGRWVVLSSSVLYLYVLSRSYVTKVVMLNVPSWITFVYIFSWNVPIYCHGDCYVQVQTLTNFRPVDYVNDSMFQARLVKQEFGP
ncbi:hypothetical protein [Marimonas lutisalis]|uniref:hypothetical protein n=1 Tax=Marimonas lutisalis TaxID=2545756 RepID=UPI0010FA27B7|nr:hypothetical protein [Marimonas lutisalis]